MSSLLNCSGKRSKAKRRSKRSKRKDSPVPSEERRLEELEETKSSSSREEAAALKQNYDDQGSNISIPSKRKYSPVPSEERRLEELQETKSSSSRKEAAALKQNYDDQGSNISIPSKIEDETIRSKEGDQLTELFERLAEFEKTISRLKKDLKSEQKKSKIYEQEAAELKQQLDEFNQHTNKDTAIGVLIPEDGSVHSAAGRRVKELEDENGKLKEDLKYERNKSRSSKQETTELKQQLEELKRNHDSSKAKESTMSVPKPTESNLDHDTDTLLIQAKIANEAANVLWKQRRKINKKKQQQEHSKTLQKCIAKYNSSFAEIRDANERMLNTLSDGCFIDMTQGRKSKLSRSLNELNRESDRLSAECIVCTKKDDKIKELEDKLERFERKEKESELHAIESSKLRDSDPNIADLSDQNRPTKIAEKLSELYDNQWKDAYDALQRKQLKGEDIIKLLKDLMMKAYTKCKSIASKKYFEKVQRSIESPVQGISVPRVSVLPDTLKQQIKEFRKLRAEYVTEDLTKLIRNELKSAHSDSEAVQAYISSCIEISWLMAVQDPPLILSTDVSIKFDTNHFKHYTRRGKYIEYVVWPALYLCEGGAVLAKGVAQGCAHPR